jgi:hypothetical protein
MGGMGVSLCSRRLYNDTPIIKKFVGAFQSADTLYPPHLRPKRQQRKLSKLKALQPERNAHNGNAEHQPDDRRRDGKFCPAQYNPQYIEQYRARARAEYNLFSKRKERQFGKLEALYAPRDAQYGHTPENPCKRPAYTQYQPAEQEP